MFSDRRCGFASIIVLAVLAFLVGGPIAFPQAITMVQSSARSAGNGATGFNGDFGSATTVSLSSPSYIVFDSNGNQYLSDTLNNCVRKIDTAGNVTTVAGLTVTGQGDTCNTSSTAAPTAGQGLYKPTGLAIDASNRLYIADSMHNCIRALAANTTGTANLVTVAGLCTSVPTDSVTPQPNGLALDAAGNLYISLQDTISATPVHQVVRHDFSAGPFSACRIAGDNSTNGLANCAGVTNVVSLVRPSGLAFNISGDLYIADSGDNCVRQIVGLSAGAATQTTAVGQCLNDGTGSSATAIRNPYGLAVSPMQSLFISESNPDNVVSFIPGSGVLKIVGGLPSGSAGAYDSTQDGKSALNTPLNAPRGIAFDSFAHLFVADSSNNITRELSSNLRFATTPVGSPSAVQPITFAINQAVNLTTAIGSDYSITSTTCSGALTPAASGAAPNTCQVFVRFTPTRPGLRRSPLKITDTISGTSVYQGLQSVGYGALSIFTPGTAATLASNLGSPATITTDAAGNAYVLETASGAADIRQVGAASALVNLGAMTPSAIAADAAGNWFVADAIHGTISRFGADGSSNAAYITGLDTPTALTVDLFNNLYIAQAGNAHNVLVAYTSGARRIVAGNGNSASADGVTAISAAFVSPSALTLDQNGTLYVADLGGHRVYAVDNAGIIHAVAGNGSLSTTVPGQAIGTALVSPSSLAVDAAGDLYIADQSTGIVYTVYRSSNGGGNIAVALNTTTPSAPNGALSIALDGSSNLFVSKNATNSVIELAYSNPSLDFGSVSINSTSAVKLQNLTNVGNDNLNITSPFSTSDSHFNVDSNSTTCGSTILAGSVCAVGFTFTPSAGASYSATSVVSSNSYNTPQPIALTGSGKQLTNLTVSLPALAETYGMPLTSSVNFSNYTATPTGTITFTYGNQVLCTESLILAPRTTCGSPTTGLSVGNYTVTFQYSGDSNYAPAAGVTNLSVNPAPLTATVVNATRQYGAANPAFSGFLTGVATGDTVLVAYSTTATVASPVGNYPITATLTPVGTTSLANYSVTLTTATLAVTPATLYVTAHNAQRVYGTANPTFTGAIAGLLNGDSITANYTTYTVPNSSVATYPVVPVVSGAALANYTVTLLNGVLTITGSPLTINVQNVSRAYGVPNPTLTGTVAGIYPGDNVSVLYSTTATAASDPGSYAITATVMGPDGGNYIPAIHTGTEVITPAPTATTVTASNTSAVSGTSISFIATVTAPNTSPAGMVSFFDGDVLLGNMALTDAGSAKLSTGTLTVGTHTISASFQANTKFTGSVATMHEVVTQAIGSFTITVDPTPSMKNAGTVVYPVEVASTGAFAGQVSLTCSGVPAGTTCSFATPTVTLTAGSSVTTTMTVTSAVSVSNLQTPGSLPAGPADLAPLTAAAIFPAELTGLGVLFAGIRRRKTLGTQKMRLLILIFFTLGILGLMGCGAANTAFKTYTVNITGTSLTFPAPAQTTSVVVSVMP